MAHHKDLQIRQVVLPDQRQLRLPGHIARNKQVKIAAAAQVCQSLLVGIARAHGRENREAALPQGNGLFFCDEQHLSAVLLGQSHQFIPHAVVVLYLRQIEPFNFHPAEQLRQAVGVVSMEVGYGHRRQAAHLHTAQLREHLLGRMLVAVAAAAIHQDSIVAGQQ